MRKTILSRRFFNRPTLRVAKDLLGKFLVRKVGPSPHKATKGKPTKTIAVQITEVEAYDGPRDRASHASRGHTPRNAPMWDVAGHFYVYFTYGMHWMLNVVTGPKGYPAAVLLRSGKLKVESEKWIEINGPARLTKYLKIDKRFNGKSARPESSLWFEDRGSRTGRSKIIASPRIGVDYAGPWAKKPYNFRLKK